jgi:signal transduction histidine kinase
MTIRRKLTLALLAIALLPVTVLLVVDYSVEANRQIEREGLAHADAAAGASDKLDRMLFERYRNLLSWAGLEVMDDILVDDIDKRVADTLRGLSTEYGVYSAIYCLDGRGNVVADGSESRHTANEASSPWFTGVMGGERCYLAADFPPSGGAPLVRMAAPIHSRVKVRDVIGVLVVEVDPAVITAVLDDLHDRLVRLGHTPRIRLWEAAAWDALPSTGVGGKSWRVLRGPDGGEQVVGFARSGGFRDFAGFHWALAVAEPIEATLAPLQHTRHVLYAVGLAAAFASLVVATLLSRGLARPLEVMTGAARAIERSGELSATLPVATGDEIGTLSLTFNRMLHRLREAQQQLVQHERLTAIGQVAAEVAHDLATPATTIANLTRRLLKGSPGGSRHREQLQLVLDSAVYVQGLVSRLLAFARSERPEPHPVRVAEIVVDAVHRMGDDPRIELLLDGELPELVGDATALTRLLVNLLDNALEAAGPHGKVRVRGYWEPATGEVWIEVRDNGAGIPEKIRDHLFEPFVTTKGQDGTGLGLAIGYRIARDHGGSLTLVDGSAGHTTFQVRLPVPNFGQMDSGGTMATGAHRPVGRA